MRLWNGWGNEESGLRMELNDGLRSLLEALVGPCLLYTSPSPRDRTRSRMPSSA